MSDLDNRLKNWAWYCSYGHIGPENPTRCASAEGNYESGEVWADPEPHYEPDMIDGEVLENHIRVLPTISRTVLKASYVQYPYHRKHTVAQMLRMSTDRLESELATAKRRLSERLQRNSTRNTGMASGEARMSDSLQSQ
jgi:hypothetical protein